jgi:hypothetical protein
MTGRGLFGRIRRGALRVLRVARALLVDSHQKGDVGGRQRHPLVVVIHHPPLGSSANFERLSWQRFRRMNFKGPNRAAIGRVNFFRLGQVIKITRVDVQEVVRFSNPSANPDGEIVVPSSLCQVAVKESYGSSFLRASAIPAMS